MAHDVLSQAPMDLRVKHVSESAVIAHAHVCRVRETLEHFLFRHAVS